MTRSRSFYSRLADFEDRDRAEARVNWIAALGGRREIFQGSQAIVMQGGASLLALELPRPPRAIEARSRQQRPASSA